MLQMVGENKNQSSPDIMEASQLLWKPSTNGKAQLDLFQRQVNSKFKLNLGIWRQSGALCGVKFTVWVLLSPSLASYHDLWKWSVDNYKDFWALVWEFCLVKSSAPFVEICEDKRMDLLPKWFKVISFIHDILFHSFLSSGWLDDGC